MAKSKVYPLETILERAIDIRETDVINSHILFASNTFSRMLTSLEKCIYENLYSHNVIDESILEVIWILRSLVTKYGGSVDYQKSAENILGPPGKQRLSMEEQLRREESSAESTGATLLLNYLFNDNYNGGNMDISCLLEESQNHKFRTAITKEYNLDERKNFCGSEYTRYEELFESTLSKIALKVGTEVLKRINEVESGFYNDLFRLWNYEGSWIRAESEGYLRNTINLDEQILFKGVSGSERPMGHFKDFFETFKNVIIRHQKILSDPVCLFEPKYKKCNRDPTLFEMTNLFSQFKEKDIDFLKNDSGWAGSTYRHFYGRLTK